MSLVDSFIPEDTSNAEQVYIPLHDSEGHHWFLLVVNMIHKQCYILDSLGVNEYRLMLVKKVLSSASVQYKNHPRLNRFFAHASTFPREVPEVPKQGNRRDLWDVSS